MKFRPSRLNKVWEKCILPIYFLFLLGACAHTLTVERVVDGDTVVLSNKSHVRLIGIDTPESLESQKLEKDVLRTHRDKKTIQLLGKKAASFTRSLILGKKIRLEYDQHRKDHYGRTLGYLYLEDGTFINLEIIKKGYAHAYTRFPFRFMDEFREAEKEARKSSQGLWEKDGGP